MDGSMPSVDLVDKLKEITAMVEKNESTINRIKKNLEEIKKKTHVTDDDSKELHKNYELLKQELLNQNNLTRQLQILTSGTPCGNDPKSTCPHACNKDQLFLPQVLVCGNPDDILPKVIIW